MPFEISETVESQLLTSLLLVAVVVLLRWIIIRIARRTASTLVARYRWRKATQYVAATIILYGLGRIWLDEIGSLTTMVGLLGAGLAVALQEPIANVAAWLYIIVRSPFEVGDRIEVGGVRGDVVDQRVFSFSLLEIGNWVDADQSTGRVLDVPNAHVFRHPVASYSQGFRFIWLELPVTITFESNWKKAKELLGKIGKDVSTDVARQARKQIDAARDRFMIRYTHLTPIVYTRVVAHGVQLTLRFLSKPQQRRSAEQRVWGAVREALAEHQEIRCAYPTQRFYRADEAPVATTDDDRPGD